MGQRHDKGRKEYMKLGMRLVLEVSALWHRVPGKIRKMANLIIQTHPMVGR